MGPIVGSMVANDEPDAVEGELWNSGELVVIICLSLFCTSPFEPIDKWYSSRF